MHYDIDQELINSADTPIPSISCPYEPPPGILECPDSVNPTSGAAPLHVITVFTVIMMIMFALLF